MISVLLGLAITHLAVGIVGVIQERDRVRPYWVHLLWVVNTTLWITQFWWFFFPWSGMASWPMGLFYLLFGYALTLSIIAGLLFPVHGRVDDYRAFFFRQVRWFFGLQVLAILIDIVEVTVKAEAGLQGIPEVYFPTIAVFGAGLGIAMLTKNPRYHGFLAIATLLLNVWFSRAVFSAIG